MKDSILDVHLITGGTGSIGSALLRRLLDDTKHAKFRVLSRNDSSQHELRNSLSEESQKRVRFILADVRGKDIGRHMAGVSNVWHCAAIKHVVGANYNADECADINIMGTSNVLTAAHMEAHHNQKDVRFVLLSTDKAASPANIMGASKYCAEQIVLGAQWAGERLVRRVVRFGNVLDSRGSVLPTFRRKMCAKEPCVITSKFATRYVMTIRQAVGVLLYAEGLEDPMPLLVVPKMNAAKVETLYRAATLQTKGFVPRRSIQKPKNIGLQPGEKLHERLLSDDEISHVLRVTDCYYILDLRSLPKIHRFDNKHDGPAARNSSAATLLAPEAIVEMIKDH